MSTQSERFIHSLTRFGSQLGLERMIQLLELLGNPQDKLKFIHIAGTNGKGSVANMCSNTLQASGYKVGLYTSPYVNHFRERFQINGKSIQSKDLTTHSLRVEKLVWELTRQGVQVTEFEAVTAIAFDYFAKSGCDLVCLEVGLGGRFDATNVIKAPEVSVITSISMDHVAILGDTIEKIAIEKAGIIKEGTIVVSYPLQNEEALQVLKQRCEETGTELMIPESAAKNITCTTKQTNFEYQGQSYHLGMIGAHQVYNAITVIATIAALRKKGYRIDDITMKSALLKTKVPGRFEKVSIHRKPHFYVDGAHNVEAIQAFSANMDTVVTEKKVAMMGMMADKDYEQSVKAIASKCTSFIAIPVNNERAADKNILADIARKYCDDVYAIDDYSEAVDKARELSGTTGAVFACGSFYMLADLKRAIQPGSLLK